MYWETPVSRTAARRTVAFFLAWFAICRYRYIHIYVMYIHIYLNIYIRWYKVLSRYPLIGTCDPAAKKNKRLASLGIMFRCDVSQLKGPWNPSDNHSTLSYQGSVPIIVHTFISRGTCLSDSSVVFCSGFKEYLSRDFGGVFLVRDWVNLNRKNTHRIMESC